VICEVLKCLMLGMCKRLYLLLGSENKKEILRNIWLLDSSW
jgi:hypothetical protein